MKKISILFLAILFSCASSTNSEKPLKVHHKGAMKNMMHKGDISAKADLNDLKDKDHLYALGAVENLKGEVLILDGKPYIASKSGEELTVDHSYGHKVTLLVYASVADWKTVSVPDSIRSYDQLEQFVEQNAEEQGLDIEKPFPFRLTGKAASFDWHVIDWKKGDTEHTHHKHKTSGLHGTQKGEEVEILGFFSKKHQGIFTHHSTNMHLHVKTQDEELAGHLDDLKLGKGMELKIPEVVQ